jgi:hypothetical protein
VRILWEGIPGLGLQPPHHVPRQGQYVFEIQEHTRFRVRQGFSPGILPEAPTRSTYSKRSCLSALPLTKDLVAGGVGGFKDGRVFSCSPTLWASAFCFLPSSFLLRIHPRFYPLERVGGERQSTHHRALAWRLALPSRCLALCFTNICPALPFLVSLADAHFWLVVSYCWVLWPMCSFSCATATISRFLISSLSLFLSLISLTRPSELCPLYPKFSA